MSQHLLLSEWALAAWCAVGVASVATRAWAGPLDKSRVDQDAAWLVHVDMERLRESPLGCTALTDRTGFPGTVLNDMRTDLGLDPSTDINSLTVYGLDQGSPTESGDSSVVLISSTAAADGLPKFMVESHPDTFEVLQEGGATLLSWKVDDRRWFVSVKTPDNPVERVVVLGRSRERIGRAISVLDSTHESMGTPVQPGEGGGETRPMTWPFDRGPATGSIVFVAANRSMWGDRGARSTAFRGARGMVLDLCERHDDAGDSWMQLSATVRMETEQGAAQMERVVKGALAWLALSAQEAESPQSCCKVLDEAQPTRSGTDVSIDLKVNSRELAAILDTVRTVHTPNVLEVKSTRPTTPENASENKGPGVTKPPPPAKNPVSKTKPGR